MAEKQKILIVDDDENIAELISLYLTKECYETKIVGDGEEALSQELTDIRSAGSFGPPPRFPLSCSPPREKSSTRFLDWSWELTIT